MCRALLIFWSEPQIVDRGTARAILTRACHINDLVTPRISYRVLPC